MKLKIKNAKRRWKLKMQDARCGMGKDPRSKRGTSNTEHRMGKSARGLGAVQGLRRGTDGAVATFWRRSRTRLNSLKLSY